MFRDYSLDAVFRLLIAVVSLLKEPEHWLLGARASVAAEHGFSVWGSWALEDGLSSSAARA